MRRGEIRVVDLDPVRGGEAGKRRPAVLVSNDAANATADHLGRGVVTVVPLTTRTDRVHPFHVLIPAGDGGLARDSKAQAEQVRSVSADRVGELVGTLPPRLLGELDAALRLHLAL